MFFNFENFHDGLHQGIFKQCVIPRPIAWISSRSSNGSVNIAPYSYFNAVSDLPPVIMFSSGTKRSKNQDKDTIRNIESSREFVVNLSTYQDRLKMVQSSTALEYGESEAEKFQIETEASSLISVPRIKSSPINLECRYIQTLELSVDGKPISSKVVFGRVVGINISEGVMTEGGVDVTKLLPIARLGGDGYALISDKFNIPKA